MKKVKILLIALMVAVLPLSMFSRGGGSHSSSSHSSSSHSYFSSSSSSRPSSFRSSSYSYKASSTSNRPSTTVRTVSSVSHVSPSVSRMTPKQTSFYHSNPSYTSVGGYYRPIYHCSPNYMFWYFVMTNNRTHRNDTIRAKSKAELDKKVSSVKSQW